MMHYDYGQAVCNPPSLKRIVSDDEPSWGYSPEDFTARSPTESDKIAYQTSLELLQRYLTATKWGRSLRDQAPFTPPSEAQRLAEQVLETFEGHVDSIEEDSAFVTLKAPSGEILKGRYSATALARYGITEGSRFECSTIKLASNACVRIDFRRLPSTSETPEALQWLRARLTLDDLDDANFRDDY
jgi:hypothetical protein